MLQSWILNQVFRVKIPGRVIIHHQNQGRQLVCSYFVTASCSYLFHVRILFLCSGCTCILLLLLELSPDTRRKKHLCHKYHLSPRRKKRKLHSTLFISPPSKRRLFQNSTVKSSAAQALQTALTIRRSARQITVSRVQWNYIGIF